MRDLRTDTDTLPDRYAVALHDCAELFVSQRKGIVPLL